MKLIKFFGYAVTILLFTNLHAQVNGPYKNNINSYRTYFKENFGIDIIIPKRFKSIDAYMIGFKVRKHETQPTGSMFSTIFISNDKNCMIAYPFSLYGFKFELEKEKRTTSTDEFYFDPKSQVINEIKISLGLYYNPIWSKDENNKHVNFDLYKYSDFIFGRQAREKYNADSFSISSLPNAEEVHFFGNSIEKLPEKKYPYCTSLFIQKDSRAAFEIKFFFTEKGFKKKEKYINMLDKHIWFDENFKPN